MMPVAPTLAFLALSLSLSSPLSPPLLIRGPLPPVLQDPGPAIGPSGPKAARTVAITGGTVHTMVAGEAPRPATLLLRGERIEAVLPPDAEVPAGAEAVDASGLHLVPGLIDGLVAFDAEHDALYVAQGVTLVRDIGRDPAVILRVREAASRDVVPGPAIRTGLAMIDGEPASTPGALVLREEGDAEKAIELLDKEGGCDFVSIHPGLQEAAWRRVVELAHGKGWQVWGPRVSAASIEKTMEVGQDGILYLDSLLPEGVTWDRVLPPAFDQVVKLLAAGDASLIPLVNGLAHRSHDPGDHPRILDLLSPQYAYQWESELELRRSAMSEENAKRLERAVERQLELLKRLHGAGVSLVPASGAPQPWLAPGEGLHDELALWQRAGIPAAKILELATAGAAAATGNASDRGSLRPGKIADIVGVQQDPRADIRNLRHPSLVVVRGQVLGREEVKRRTDDVVAENEARRAELSRPLPIADPDCAEGELLLSGTVETISLGQRMQGERYCVVREADGALVYTGRRLIPASGGIAAREVDVVQRVRNGQLSDFTVTMRVGGQELSAVGLWIGNRFNVERRINGEYLMNQKALEHVAAVSVGSVTTPLLLGHANKTGILPVMYFHESMEPVVEGWQVAYQEDQGLFGGKTPRERFWFALNPDGSLVKWVKQVGQAFTETAPIEQAVGGGGIPSRSAGGARGAKEQATPVEGSAPGGAGPAASGGERR